MRFGTAKAAVVACALAGSIALGLGMIGRSSAFAIAPGSVREARVAAIDDARERLAAVALPAGADPAADFGPGLHLDGPAVEPGSPDLARAHSLFISSRSRKAALAWFRGHPPDGSKLSESGSLKVGDRVAVRYLDFAWPDLLGSLRERTISIALASTRSGRAAIRIDAEAVWVTPRSPGEMLPEATRYIDLKLCVGGELLRSEELSDPGEVAAIKELIDGFEVVQSDDGFCPSIPGPEKALSLTFRASADGPLLAEAVQVLPAWCGNPLQLTIDGKRRRNLEGGQALVERLLSDPDVPVDRARGDLP